MLQLNEVIATSDEKVSKGGTRVGESEKRRETLGSIGEASPNCTKPEKVCA